MREWRLSPVPHYVPPSPAPNIHSMCDVQRLIYVDTDESCMYIDRRAITVNVHIEEGFGK